MLLATLFAAAAAIMNGCGGGGSGDSVGAAAPSIAPGPSAPSPSPSPSPPAPTPSPTVPPLGAPVSIDDNHAVGVEAWPAGDTAGGGQGQEVQGVQCGAMVETYHVHAHLTIAVDGVLQAFPPFVGIPSCHYWLHTHDASGKVHVEAPIATVMNLGQLFAIWGRPLGETNVADIAHPGPVVFYVTEEDGSTRIHTGDPASIELTSHRQITIQIGQPLAEIPNFTWSAP